MLPAVVFFIAVSVSLLARPSPIYFKLEDTTIGDSLKVTCYRKVSYKNKDGITEIKLVEIPCPKLKDTLKYEWIPIQNRKTTGILYEN